MKCENCGQWLPEDSVFCTSCGTKVSAPGAEVDVADEERIETAVETTQEAATQQNPLSDVSAPEEVRAPSRRCVKCKYPLRDGSTFCLSCGEKQPVEEQVSASAGSKTEDAAGIAAEVITEQSPVLDAAPPVSETADTPDMLCKKCGHQLFEDSVFCWFCGEAVSAPDPQADPVSSMSKESVPPSRPCVRCGQELPLDSTFCRFCGEKQPLLAQETGGSGQTADDPTRAPEEIASVPKKTPPKKEKEKKVRRVFPSRAEKSAPQGKRAGGKTAGTVALAVLAAALIGVAVYQAIIIRDQNQQMQTQEETILELNQQVETQEGTILGLNQQMETQAKATTTMQLKSTMFDEIEAFSNATDIGEMTDYYYASEKIIFLRLGGAAKRVTLTTDWEGWGDISFQMTDPSIAEVRFNRTTWSIETTFSVYPRAVGTTRVHFINEDNALNFSILIVVTE